MPLTAVLQLLGFAFSMSSCLETGIPIKPTLNITGVPLEGFSLTFTCDLPTTANLSRRNSTFSPSETNSTFNLSDTTLNFSLHHTTSDLTFSWFVNDTLVKEDAINTMILNVSRSDTGFYHCTVQDFDDQMLRSFLSDKIFLDILISPMVRIKPGETTGVIQEIEGEFVTLTCSVDPASLSVPTNSYTWSYRPSHSDKEVTWPVKERHLVVGPLSRADSGNYSCVVTNDVIAPAAVKQGIASVILDVLYGPSVRIESQGIHSSLLNLTAGQDGQLTCLVTDANPPVPHTGYSWSFLPASSATERPLGERGPVLNLASVSRSSSGQYRCQVRNDVGLNWTFPVADVTVRVVVHYLENLITSDDVEVREGDVISITCSVDSFPRPRMTWWAAGRKLRDVTSLSDEYVIGNAQCSDSAEYTCAVVNDVIASEMRLSVTVQVLCAPRRTGSVESIIVVKEGGTARFFVSVTAYPPPTFRWFSPRQRGVVLTSDSPNQTHATLTLTKVEVKDSGSYVLNASNSVGFLCQEFHLRVEEDIGDKLMTVFNLTSFLIFVLGLTVAVSFGIYVTYKFRARKAVRQSRMSRGSHCRWPDLLKEERRTGTEEPEDDFYFQSNSSDYNDAISAL